jgi:hypothetical protein
MADLSNARVFSHEALEIFTRNLVEQFAPEKVILPITELQRQVGL